MFPGEEEEKDPSNLIYDILECFLLTWEELMGISSTTGYDIWNEDNLEIATPTYGGRHFKPHLDNSIPIYGGRHFKPQYTKPRDRSKIAHITRGGERHFKPPHLETDNLVEALNKVTQQTPNEEDEVLKLL